jgi:hypothetical protein
MSLRHFCISERFGQAVFMYVPSMGTRCWSATSQHVETKEYDGEYSNPRVETKEYDAEFELPVVLPERWSENKRMNNIRSTPSCH